MLSATPLFLIFLTFLATFAGGIVAIRMRDRLHLILGFTSGVLLGVVAFDLLPEIFEMVHENNLDARWPMVALVAGFLLFHSGEALLLIHHAHEDSYANHKHPQVGIFSAFALIAHSFLDGVGIGLGFQVSPAVGAVVATAVIAHDFADGFNTVSLMMAHRNSSRRAIGMLVLDACAPVLGILSTSLFKVPPPMLSIYLGFFAGFLIHISISDILPEAHAGHRSTGLTIFLTCLGAAFIFAVQAVMSGGGAHVH